MEEYSVAIAKLTYKEMRLADYDRLMDKLKRFDWFEFNSGGGIVAHEKNEPTDPAYLYGTMFMVPYEMIAMNFH